MIIKVGTSPRILRPTCRRCSQPAFLISPRLRERIYQNLRRCARTKGSTYCTVRLRALSLSRLVSPGICAPSLRAPVRNAGYKFDKFYATGLNYLPTKHYQAGLEFGRTILDGYLDCFIQAYLTQASDDHRSPNS